MASYRGIRYWMNAWIPVAIGVGIIFAESTEWMGADHTSGPLRFLFQALFGPISTTHWEIIHALIRKSGHFLGYGLIGLAWFRAWRLTFLHSRFAFDAFLAMLGTALLASADEYHQTFLPNRTGSWHDVLLDCCGAIVLQLLLYIFLRQVGSRRLTRAA
jgi:VanZ family protein